MSTALAERVKETDWINETLEKRNVKPSNVIPYKKNPTKRNYKNRILLRKIFKNIDEEGEFPEMVQKKKLHNVLQRLYDGRINLETENENTSLIKDSYGEEGLEIFKKMRDYVLENRLEAIEKDTKKFYREIFQEIHNSCPDIIYQRQRYKILKIQMQEKVQQEYEQQKRSDLDFMEKLIQKLGKVDSKMINQVMKMKHEKKDLTIEEALFILKELKTI